MIRKTNKCKDKSVQLNELHAFIFIFISELLNLFEISILDSLI